MTTAKAAADEDTDSDTVWEGFLSLIKEKQITLAEAAAAIPDGATLALSGFIGAGVPEELYMAVRDAFRKNGHPRDLTLFYSGGQGDRNVRGVNLFAEPGLIRRVICGHWNLAPKLQEMARAEQIEAYNLPQGIITQLFRDICAHRPGTLTKVGLGTFVDPDLGGGRLNARATDELVKKITIEGETYLLYRPIPINAVLLRGTCADAAGNISFSDERYRLETLDLAMACKNCGGKVIVQVKEVCEDAVFPADKVGIPHIFVDHIVKNTDAEYHSHTYGSGHQEKEYGAGEAAARDIVARRAALEVRKGDVLNLGIGLPEAMVPYLTDAIVQGKIICTLETGVIGGIPMSGMNFGMAKSPLAVVDTAALFNYYNGGGLSRAFLGMAECDAAGNVNVSSFSSRIAGAGGFIDISQSTKNVVFCGQFAVGVQAEIKDNKVLIRKEGVCKIVKQVQHITFSANMGGQNFLYITERCVFHLTENGLELTEIAPGIDLERDILSHIDFPLSVSKELKQMDARIFDDRTFFVTV